MHVPQLLVGLIVEPQLTLDVGGHVGVIAVFVQYELVSPGLLQVSVVHALLSLH